MDARLQRDPHLLKPDSRPPVIVWFRRDLRLDDNPALLAAARSGQPLLPVYVRAPGERQPGGASRWWLHGSLEALDRQLGRHGARLILRQGTPHEELAAVAAASGADSVCWNRSSDPDGRSSEDQVRRALQSQLELRAYPGDSLAEPGSVLTAEGKPPRVFTPFWRACLRRPPPAVPAAAPTRWPAWRGEVPGARLEDWRLRPDRPDWARGLRENWQPGEPAAQRALQRFIDEGLAEYPVHRDRPDLSGTSRISPHLHFGEIGPRQVWHAVQARAAGDARLAAGAESFLRQIGWREFSLHLLHHWPDLATSAFRREFAGFPWQTDATLLRAWQRGETGYPLVDAGMRELWARGWMHNRVRMVVASFLVKHLLIDWREGEQWFWDTLVDADAANNAASWQWVAGCGADAAPYFRIFNPVLQASRFDPEGDYVRRWVPELRRLPTSRLHAPWTASATELRAAVVTIGRTYPPRVVEHQAARQRALDAFRRMRATG